MRHFFHGVVVAAALAGAAGARVAAQQAQGAPPPAVVPPAARVAAPIDMAGTWASVITEDWQWRFVTPIVGDYTGVPLNADGDRLARQWNPEADVKRIMQEPFTMIASDSGVRQNDESVPHPRGYGNNARVLGYYSRDLHLISLEDAVRKMTSLPAQTFGFRDRGLIREGFAADLVIFDEKTIGDRATYDKPHQFPVGISFVLVNGRVVLSENQLTNERPGSALRGPGYVSSTGSE